MKQFSYTRLEKIDKPLVDGKEQPVEFKSLTDTFNIEKVIRSVERPDGSRLIVLDDFHEEVRPSPVYNSKNKITGYKNQKNTYQSEILLNDKDAVRFMDMVKNLVF